MAAPTVDALRAKYEPLIQAQAAAVQRTIVDGRAAAAAAQAALSALQVEFRLKKEKILAYEKALALRAELTVVIADAPIL
jgi:hypothetical protein